MPRKLKFYLPKNYEAKKVDRKNPECQLIISVPFEVYESTPTTSFVSPGVHNAERSRSVKRPHFNGIFLPTRASGYTKGVVYIDHTLHAVARS